MKNPRSLTRDFLFQALYSKVFLWDTFDKEELISSFFGEECDCDEDMEIKDKNFVDKLDNVYFDEMFEWIVKKEWNLAHIIWKFAPKFNIKSMPLINVIPIYIASYEILYLKCDKIPIKVCIDEAIEFTKTYGDEAWKILVNWILNSLKENIELVRKEAKESIQKENIFYS